MPLRITIGIATWNRCDLLKRTLESLAMVIVPDDVTIEVLVCDNNSTDQTRQAIERAMSDLPVRYLFEATQGKAHALNHIIDHATGEWIIYTDDDVLFDAHFLHAYTQGLRRYPDATMFGGQVLPWIEHTISSRSAYLLKTFPWVNAVLTFQNDTAIALAGGHMPYGNNMAVRTDVLKQEPFDALSTMKGGQRGAEDTELIERLLAKGHTGWLLSECILKHHIPPARVGFRWFCKWHLGAGQYWIRERGLAPAARWGLRLWLWKLVAKRMLQFIVRYRPGNPRKSYECIADAMMHVGYAKASDLQRSE